MPVLLWLLPRKMKEEARLVLLRTTHVAVLGVLPILLWSVAQLHVRGEPGIRWWGWAMLVYGVVATVVFRTITRKKIVQAPTVAEAGISYVSGYLILLGLATSEALFGHALVYLGGGTAAAVVGTALSLPLLWLIAPRRDDIESLESHLVATNGGNSLTAELMRPHPVATG
jgi:hypothetical protein